MKYIKKFESIECSSGETKYLQYAPSENTIKDYFIAELEDIDTFELSSIEVSKTIQKYKSYKDCSDGLQYYEYEVEIWERFDETYSFDSYIRIANKLVAENKTTFTKMQRKYDFIINSEQMKHYQYEGGIRLIIKLKFYFEDPTYQNFN